MPPPTDLRIVEQVGQADGIMQRLGLIFVETRDADMDLLNSALQSVQNAGGDFSLVTVGPVNKLSETWKRRTISEADELEHIRALCEAQIFLSVRKDSPFDLHCVRGLLAGCVPVVPNSGVYLELLPAKLQAAYTYPPQPEDLADRLLQMLTTAATPADGIGESLKPLEALSACRAFDERLQALAAKRHSA
jgi:hypothetical protein